MKNKIRLEMLKSSLEKGLAEAEQLNADGQPHPYVIGYLMGTIKLAIQNLETYDTIEKSRKATSKTPLES